MQNINLLHAEQRASIAEIHASELADSLQRIESLLPLLLQSEEIEKIDKNERNCDIREAFVLTLRNVLHRYKYMDELNESISIEEWNKLNNEEAHLQLSIEHKNTADSNAVNLIPDEQYLLLQSSTDSKQVKESLKLSGDNNIDNNYETQAINLEIEEEKQSLPKLTWKSRYYSLRETANKLSSDLEVCQNDLLLTKNAMQELCDSIITQEIISENYTLRKQTALLRNEILSLKSQISEIQVTAVQAFQSIGIDDQLEIATTHIIPHSPASNDDLFSNTNGRDKIESSDRLNVGNIDEDLNRSSTMNLDENDSCHDSENEEAVIPSSNNSTNKNNRYPSSPSDQRRGSEQLQQPDDPLEIALSAIQIPIIEDRFLKELFLKYATITDKKVTICVNSFKYFRFLKDYAITVDSTKFLNENNISMNRSITYGDANIVYQESLKLDTKDKINNHSKGKNSLKGGDEWKPNSSIGLSCLQFQSALASLALRLYADIIEIEFETEIYLLRGAAKNMATKKALEILLQDKLIPIAVQQDILPWALIHLERTLFALQQLPSAFQILVQNRALIISWFIKYATTLTSHIDVKQIEASIAVEDITDQIATDLKVKSKNSLNYLRAVTNNALHSELIDDESSRFIADSSVAGWSYKACSKFTHDFGIVPHLLKEAQLFGYFKEIFIWTRNNETVSLNALPVELHMALQSSIINSHFQIKFKSLQKHSNDPKQDKTGGQHNIPRNEEHRINLSSFIILLCVIAIRAFPHEMEDKRMQQLFESLKYEIL